MHKAVLWVQTVFVPAVGPLGLFVVAFLDSSFLSLPEINDILVVTSASAHPGQAWLYAAMATLGSLAGCLALWKVGNRGGEPLLIRRFGPERVTRTRAAFRRWGVLAIAIPAVLPPPMPFKIFVLSAGVFGFPVRRFALTLLVARGLRYSFWAFMGVTYGTRALLLLQRSDAWFRDHWPYFVVLGGGALAALLLVLAGRALRARLGAREA